LKLHLTRPSLPLNVFDILRLCLLKQFSDEIYVLPNPTFYRFSIKVDSNNMGNSENVSSYMQISRALDEHTAVTCDEQCETGI